MFNDLFARFRRDDDNPAALYGAIVTQARSAALYSEIGVPDTVSGRFEMVLLHAILLSRRLEMGEELARATGQAVFDHFCRDMDNSLREMGVGDLSVPKHMRHVGEAYFGRMAAYGAGLSVGDPAVLAEAIERIVFGGGGVSSSALLLAHYAVAAAEQLSGQDENTILSGSPGFPRVEAYVCGGTRCVGCG